MSTRERSDASLGTSEGEVSPRFKPLRRAGTFDRALLLILGPLLWVAGLVAVSYVVRHGEAIGYALVALGGSALLALLLLVPMRIGRVRREREQ